MHIEQAHALGQAEAIRRIKHFGEELQRKELPAGVVLKEVNTVWQGNEMTFSFTAKKGFFGATVTGVMVVADDLVVMDAVLPGILTAFMPEAKIRAELQGELARLLAG